MSKLKEPNLLPDYVPFAKALPNNAIVHPYVFVRIDACVEDLITVGLLNDNWRCLGEMSFWLYTHSVDQ